VFSDINRVANWTNHLIRIDRPNTVQTIHTKLAFTSTSNYANLPPAQVNIDRLDVKFHADHPDNYQKNWEFSPEFYLMQQALTRNSTGGRYRVDHVRLIGGRVNDIPTGDIVTLDAPFRFAGKFALIGKVEVASKLQAHKIISNYPLDVMDLVQFNRFRVPINNLRGTIRLANIAIDGGNRASFVRTHFLNGVSFDEFVLSIMSLTKPQVVYSSPVFQSTVDFQGLVKTGSSLNGIKGFNQFARNLKTAKYIFEEGLQCTSVSIA
jgi:hypothetical protein